MATLVSDADYWVGVRIDEVVLRGEFTEVAMAGIDLRGKAGNAGVIEFVRSEPQVIDLWPPAVFMTGRPKFR